MKLYLDMFGAPGVGKGTHSEHVSQVYKIPHISTGDIFRGIIKGDAEYLNQTELQNKNLIENGQLVPDDITIDIVRQRINKDDCYNGWVLDGFPRTIPQAEALQDMADLTQVLRIVVPDEIIVERLSGRVIGSDNLSYHLVYNLPPDGMEYRRRKDDEPETIRKRLEAYHENTFPLIEFYRNLGIITDVSGIHEDGKDKDIDEVAADIEEKIDDLIDSNFS